MVVRFAVLLLSSFTVILRLEPSFAFSSFKCKSATDRMQHRLPPNYLSSQSNENSKVEKNVFSKCAQSLAITAASLQLLSAGHVSALPSTFDEVTQSAITKSIEISDMVAKFPEAASFLKDVDFAAKSSEILNNIQQYPLVPSGSKLLTTTVRPDDKDSESREAQLKRIQWWKNTGFSLEKVNMDVQSKLKSLPDEISSLDIKSLPKDVRFWGGIAGVFFIADIFQQSNQLNKMVDDLRLKLTDREAKLNSSNTMNRDTINLLKTDYLKVIDEVDSLIKQLDDKASHITVLNETLQSLTLTVNTTDTNSKQMLTQYSRQLVSADSLIRSLKSQIVELPRKVAREVASDYKNQITMSEKRNDELQMEIARMVKEGAKTNVNVATKDHPPAIAAPAVSQFPTLSRSFPSSIFSPPVSPLVIENEKQAAEISQIKIAIVELENENKREKADKNELEIKLDALKGTLTLTESELSAKKSAENLYFDILNGRLSAMEKQISEFMSENRELKEKLSVAEGELKRLAIREEERMDMEAKRTAEDAKVAVTRAESSDSEEKSILLSQLTRENDDLKQRLLNSDERLFDLQQDNLNKLEAAKIMTKQLNARLTEIGVQQENKDGKILLQVKELEEAKEVALKQLLEAQNSLATMTSQQGQSTTLESVEVSVQVESTEKVTKTVKPKSAKAAAAKEAALNNIKDVKPYQMARKSKKELEEILLSLGITDPLSKLSKSALMDLVNKEISGGLSI